MERKFVIETLRIKYWKIYLSNCVKQIGYKPEYKIEQKLLYWNTYVIGSSCKQSDFILLPKKSCLRQYKHILQDDMKHNYPNMSDKEFDDIMNIILKTNYDCKMKMKKEINEIQNISLKLEKTTDDVNSNIIFNIVQSDSTVNLNIPKKEYSKLETLYINQKKKTDLDWYICILLTRYKYYGYVQEGICLSAGDVYSFIQQKNLSDKTLEAFAGTINSNLPMYCSLFYDIEKYFGSRGSFFKKNDECFNIIVSNPPYISVIIDESSDVLLSKLDTCDSLTVIVVIPDWRSEEEFTLDKNVQISLKDHIQTRQQTAYKGYTKLRQSKHFRKVLSVGDYNYYNFFKDSYKSIRDNTLFVLLDNNNSNLVNEFIDYMFIKS